ncbi:unnamed protein product [Rangifer tarandus platyrhynchus]|uniref:Uncharacterized protein n=1 Tax=Rangifer tarandus platyrhynchus TaxID=3082113 RepID=A0AC59YN42_RANTA
MQGWGNGWELRSMLGQTRPQDLSEQCLPQAQLQLGPPAHQEALSPLRRLRRSGAHTGSFLLPSPHPTFSLCFSMIAKSTITQHRKTMQTSTAVRNHAEAPRTPPAAISHLHREPWARDPLALALTSCTSPSLKFRLFREADLRCFLTPQPLPTSAP